MKTVFAVAVLSVALFSGFAMAADPDNVGSLVLVEIGDAKKDIAANVGDLLQFEISYPVVPGQMISDLKIELSGKGLTKAATVHVAKRSAEGKPLVGAMAIAGFIRSEKAGDYTVKITPVMANGKNGEIAEFNVKIAAK